MEQLVGRLVLGEPGLLAKARKGFRRRTGAADRASTSKHVPEWKAVESVRRCLGTNWRLPDSGRDSKIKNDFTGGAEGSFDTA
jgi:hypothetical protein